MKTLTTLCLTFALATFASAQSQSVQLTVIPTQPLQNSTSLEFGFSPSATDWVDQFDSGTAADILADSNNVHAFSMSMFSEVISAVDCRYPINRDRESYLGFYTQNATQIRLTAASFGFGANDSTCQPAYIWLENSVTGQLYSLLNDTVTVNLAPNTDFHSEYVLHMGPRVLTSFAGESCFQVGDGKISVHNYNNYDWKFNLYKNSQLYSASHMNNCDTTFSSLQPGTYQLVVYNNVIPVDSTTFQIGAAASLAPSFVLSNYLPNSNDLIVFTGISNGAVAYAWDFGDGHSDSIAIVDHVYTAGGNYTASLQVTSANGCAETYSENISVTGLPMANLPPVHDHQSLMNSASSTERTDAPRISQGPGKIIVTREQVSGTISIVVLSLNGQLISNTTSGEAQTEIAVPSNGIYLVTLTNSDNSITTEKVMINN